jgi:hypothetical protein
MAERLKAPVLKTGDPRGSVGSNPTPSANFDFQGLQNLIAAETTKANRLSGPLGKILNQALQEAGIERSNCYVTNAVKHFKWTMRGERRISGNFRSHFHWRGVPTGR